MPITSPSNFARARAALRFTVTPKTGNVYFVDSVTGSATGGYTADAPAATLAQALALCTDNNNDTIFLFPTHAEAVIAAGTITINKIGVTIVGLGQGTSRPTFSWTTISSATMLITAAGVSIENCIFDIGNGITGLVSGIVISAAGVTIKGGTFYLAKAGTWISPLQSILTTAGADWLTIDGNYFIGPPLTSTTVSAATSAIALVGGTGIRIINNTIHGWFTTTVGGISGVTTLTNNVLIANNNIGNQTASAAVAISLLTNSTGFIVNNRLGVLTGTAPVVADKCFEGGNVYVAAQSVTAGTASTF